MTSDATPDFDARVLGEAGEPVAVDSREAVLRASVSMARQARRTLDILSLELDPGIYDDAAFIEAARQFALGSAGARVRVLVRDAAPAVRNGHRLLELARRLSTFFEIRVTAREHHQHNAAFLIADETGTVHRTLADEFRGTVSFRNRREAADLTRLFDEMWNAGEHDPNLRRLHI